MLPTVIFVGPTKCGTTWIDSYLRTRPEVGLPLQQKETFFFDKCFERGLAWYEAQFGTSSEIGVEVAPSLFHKSQARENLAKTLPNTRVVIVYRDPVDRAISHYFHFRKSGEPAMTIDDMARAHPSIIDAGRFRTHAAQWEALFPGRVFYLEYATLKSDPVRFCRNVCSIIGITPPKTPLPTLMRSSVNAASIPRSALLARIVRRAAELARRNGLHGIVNRLRKTKLKKFIFSGSKDISKERQSLEATLPAFKYHFEKEYLELSYLKTAHISGFDGGRN